MVVETRNQSMADVQELLEGVRLYKDAQEVRHQEMRDDIASIKEMLRSFLAQKHPIPTPPPESNQSSSQLVLSQEEETTQLVLQDEPISGKEPSDFAAHQVLDEMPKSSVNGESIIAELVDDFEWKAPPMGSIKELDCVNIKDEYEGQDSAQFVLEVEQISSKESSDFTAYQVLDKIPMCFDPGGADLTHADVAISPPNGNHKGDASEEKELIHEFQVSDHGRNLDDVLHGFYSCCLNFVEMVNGAAKLNLDRSNFGFEPLIPTWNSLLISIKLLIFDPGGKLIFVLQIPNVQQVCGEMDNYHSTNILITASRRYRLQLKSQEFIGCSLVLVICFDPGGTCLRLRRTKSDVLCEVSSVEMLVFDHVDDQSFPRRILVCAYNRMTSAGYIFTKFQAMGSCSEETTSPMELLMMPLLNFYGLAIEFMILEDKDHLNRPSDLFAHQLLEEMPRSIVRQEVMFLDEIAKINDELEDRIDFKAPPMSSVEELHCSESFHEFQVSNMGDVTALSLSKLEFSCYDTFCFDHGGDLDGVLHGFYSFQAMGLCSQMMCDILTWLHGYKSKVSPVYELVGELNLVNGKISCYVISLLLGLPTQIRTCHLDAFRMINESSLVFVFDPGGHCSRLSAQAHRQIARRLQSRVELLMMLLLHLY